MPGSSDLRPELYAELESGRPVSEKILETADKLRADLIIMGLHDSAYTGVISRLDLATTYDVVCQAGSPVLTVNCSSGYDLRARPTKVTASPLSETDAIRSHGFGGEREAPSTRCRKPRRSQHPRPTPCPLHNLRLLMAPPVQAVLRWRQ